ncbi:threonine-phosphate decarboxylase CobD [Allochromatium palmeri]|uniref:threonine-phosphate decarboxylase CobD n=1 Tax=Allochromatium palmeri TaxID=231048 RepID=UPI0031B62E56
MHGGRLREAAKRFGRPLEAWIDLSTGINPNAWPVPAVPPSVWARLPEDDDGLEVAAERYYAASGALPLAGSQAAIQLLPTLRPPGRVGIPEVGYREHAHAWHRAGHRVISLPDGDPGDWLDDGPEHERLDVLVVINPNNPTGRRWPVATLLDWHARLAARGGWLVVDEAFMDVTPAGSLLPHVGRPGLVVLRSLGKFFGLAGARVGFLFAEPELRERAARAFGPWTLSGPSRWIARLALEDRAWQSATRAALPLASDRLAKLLSRHGLSPAGGTALFQWVLTPRAEQIQTALCAQGILTRRFDHPSSLRFGLPECEAEWERLEQALGALDRR